MRDHEITLRRHEDDKLPSPVKIHTLKQVGWVFDTTRNIPTYEIYTAVVTLPGNTHVTHCWVRRRFDWASHLAAVRLFRDHHKPPPILRENFEYWRGTPYFTHDLAQGSSLIAHLTTQALNSDKEPQDGSD